MILANEWLHAGTDLIPDGYVDWYVMHLMDDGTLAPVLSVRRHADTAQWEIGVWGHTPLWTTRADISTLEEAQATAMAMWKLR